MASSLSPSLLYSLPPPWLLLLQRQAREAKKEMKSIFREETGKAQRRMATAQVQAAVKVP